MLKETSPLTEASEGGEELATAQLDKLQALIDLIHNDQEVEQLPLLLMPHLVSLFDPDVACIYAKNVEAGDYRGVASYPDELWQQEDFQSKYWRRPKQGGAIGKVIQTRKTFFVDDPETAESQGDYIPFSPDMGNEVAIPVLVQNIFGSKESVEAIIILSRRVGYEFTSREHQILNLVSSVVSAIYNNSVAKTHKEKRIQFFRRITEIQTADLDLLFRTFLIGLSEIIPSYFMTLWLFNELDDTLVARSFYPSKIRETEIAFESLDSRVIRCSESLSGLSVQSKTPMVFTQAFEAERFQNPLFAAKHNLQWFVSVPVLDVDQKPLGVINIWPIEDKEEFNERSLNTLFDLIAPVANTIRLASLLFEEDLLFAYDVFFNNMIEFQDQQRSWDDLASLIRERMKCAGCSIFLADSYDVLQLKGTTGLIGDPPYHLVTYKPGEGLTGTAYQGTDPLIYYSEAKANITKKHISKYREKIEGKSKSIIFAQIFDQSGHPVGIIRCNNKEETPARHVGRFTKEDVLQLKKISQIISSIHSKVKWLKEKERERERNLNSLHHELLSPLEGITAHINWMEYHFKKWDSCDQWDMTKLALKFSDMKQNAKLIEMIVTSMARHDYGSKLKLTEVSLPHILETCKGFLINDANRNGVKIVIETLYIAKLNGDALQLMSLFYNLFRNAIRYSDPKESDKFIRIYVSSNQRDHFVLSFSDNGIGVMAGDEERIFQMFERGTNAAKYFPEGSGLGLAFCRRIMSRHGGEINIDRTNRAKPTIFHLKFQKKAGA